MTESYLPVVPCAEAGTLLFGAIACIQTSGLYTKVSAGTMLLRVPKVRCSLTPLPAMKVPLTVSGVPQELAMLAIGTGAPIPVAQV